MPGDFVHSEPTPVVTIHDACQSANALGLGAGRRAQHDRSAGLRTARDARLQRLLRLRRRRSRVDYPQVSTAILGKKLANASDTAADVVVSDNPGCIMQLRGGMIANGAATRVMHIAELMAERLPGKSG